MTSTRMDPEHADKLKEMMRHSTDPRWVERQMVNDYAEPGPDLVVSSKAMSAVWWILAVVIGGGMLWWGIANAAEPADHMRPHEITLLLPPDLDRPGIITISAAYPDRAACEKAKQRVTVKAPGAKLVCGIANPFRVK